MTGLLFRSPEPLWQRLLLAPLWPVAGLFGAGAAVRRALYRRGVFPVARAGIPVLSVGNLAVGGAGKTPVVIHLARALAARGARVAVLSRGYGGAGRGARIVSRGEGPLLAAADAGDEPVLIARRCPGVAVLVGPSRAELAALAVRELSATVALLDDGFQHLGLARDHDLVVLDGAAPFGNGYLLPRGPLREGPAALGRARLAWISKADEGEPGAISAAAAEAERWTGLPPIRSRYRAAGLLRADLSGPFPGELAGRRVVAFSGLARPASFARTLRLAGAEVAEELRFPDHHRFGPAELAALLARARVAGAELAVCTEKDAVRLSPEAAADGRLAALRIELELTSGEESLEALLREICPGG